MKTAEEILNEVLVDVENRPVFFREQDVADLIGQAQKEAFKEGQSNPKIKQLEWGDDFKETRWYCDSPIGFYIIDTVRKYEPYRVRFYLSEYDLPKNERYCKTIEEAMMCAQSDFEARIKECLITE